MKQALSRRIAQLEARLAAASPPEVAPLVRRLVRLRRRLFRPPGGG